MDIFAARALSFPLGSELASMAKISRSEPMSEFFAAFINELLTRTHSSSVSETLIVGSRGRRKKRPAAPLPSQALALIACLVFCSVLSCSRLCLR